MKFKQQVSDYLEQIEQINRTLIMSIKHASISPMQAIEMLEKSIKSIERCNEFLNQETQNS